MKLMNSRTATALALVSLSLAAPCAHAQTGDKTINLKISLWAPTTHPLYAAMQDWGASVEKASGGTLKYTIYPSEQLGKAFDHYDMARDGIADMTYVSPGYQPGRFPIFAAGNLPFLMTNAKGGSRGFDAWYRKYADREMKDVIMCMAFVHDPGGIHSREKKIVLPTDLSGMKIRPANSTIAALVTSLGGTNVQASALEARDVIEKGVADAITFPWGSTVLYGIDKVTKYHMDAPLYVSTFIFAFNKNRYRQMSDAQKKVIDSHCNNEWAGRVSAGWADFEFAGRAKIAAEPGQTVYPLSAEQTAAWKRAAEPLHKEWASAARKAGVDPDAAMKELEASLDKFGALAK